MNSTLLMFYFNILLLGFNRKVIEILHKVHKLDLEKELGAIPDLPDLVYQCTSLLANFMTDVAKGLDSDPR